MELADSSAPARSASEAGLDLDPVADSLGYPPILNTVVPAAILLVSTAYAWSLRDIVNPEMNLLLLQPLFVVVWALLLLVALKDVVPSIRAQFAPRPIGAPISWRERFAPGTEAGAGLVVVATFAFSLFGPGDGAVAYLASLFVYLVVAGWLMGDRQPLMLFARSAACALGLYLVMGVLLDVPL